MATPQSEVTNQGAPQPEVINAQAWLKSTPPKPDPVLYNWFDIGDKVCVIGGPKMHKTWFLLQLAICISMGKKFLGIEVRKPRRVLFIQVEVTESHFHRRFRMVATNVGIDGTATLFFINGRGLDLNEQNIIKAARECKAEVIILDPLYKLITGDENAAHGIKPVLAMFDRIATETGAAIVYTHHDSKGTPGDRDIRDRGAGSNVLSRDYDTCITLTPHQRENLQVVQMLTRNYPQQDPFTISWHDGLFSLEDVAPIALKQNSGNHNSTTNQPNKVFFNALQKIIQNQNGINKGALVDELRKNAGLTINKAKLVIDAGLSDNIIYSNNGKQLPHKQVIFSLNPKSLKDAMSKIKAQQQTHLFGN